MAREPRPFKANHFDGGRNHNSTDKGPTLIQLLNTTNEAFFSGEIHHEIRNDILTLYFQATCPITNEMLRGVYCAQLSMYYIGSDPPYKCANEDVIMEGIGTGTLVPVSPPPALTFRTNQEGQFSISLRVGFPDVMCAVVYPASSVGRVFVPVDRTHLIRNLVSDPIVIDAHT